MRKFFNLEMLDYNQIKKILPYTYPFLLIDSVTQITQGRSLTGIKNISANEWPFSCADSFQSESAMPLMCYENNKIYPQTLLIEAAAQAALILFKVSSMQNDASLFFLGKAKAEFFGTVSVGDQVNFNVTAGRMLATGGYSDIDITVNNERKAFVEIIYKK